MKLYRIHILNHTVEETAKRTYKLIFVGMSKRELINPKEGDF
jgi:hypothetical protein